MSYEDQDPKTVEALEKIKAILTEYDLWAAMTVVSAERVHWLYHFEPSWSCLHFDPDAGRIHFRAKREDFATKEQHQQVVNLTTGAVAATRDMAVQQFAHTDQMYKLLEKKFTITHTYSDPQYYKGKKK